MRPIIVAALLLTALPAAAQDATLVAEWHQCLGHVAFGRAGFQPGWSQCQQISAQYHQAERAAEKAGTKP